MSRFAFDADTSGIVVAIFRTIVMSTILGSWLAWSGRGWRLPPKLLPVTIANGAIMGIMTLGNIGAVEFISIGLAALLFFTFPIVIAVLVIALKMEEVRAIKLFAILLAFVGLAIMLGVSLGAVDWRGPAFSLTASVASAVNAVLVARYFKGTNVFVITFHFSVFGLLTLGLIGLLLVHVHPESVRPPVSTLGWIGVFSVAVLQGIGTPMYLYAITKIGALKTGMLTNIQPVTSVGQAWLIFGEVLSLLQALGGLLVLVAIAIMQWADWRRNRT